jgi:hypothetical protein
MTDQHPDISSDSTSSEAVINEALGVIDNALAKMMRRELVSSGEVADLLLDVRSLLTAETAADDVVVTPVEAIPTDAV